jgi:hypothetical protein
MFRTENKPVFHMLQIKGRKCLEVWWTSIVTTTLPFCPKFKTPVERGAKVKDSTVGRRSTTSAAWDSYGRWG